jgi:hypothetical protein
MKRNYHIYLLLVVALTVSCKKLIQVPPVPDGYVTSAQAFGDSADIMSSVAGIYINFQGPTGPAWPLEQYMGLASDELVFGQDPQYYPEYGLFATNTVTATDVQASGFWSSMYGSQSLYQVNVCLEGIKGNAAVSAALNRQLTGELRVLRAFYYFQLANLFGGVPLVTSTDYSTTQSLPRTSMDSVYSWIQTELDTAVQLLTPAYPYTDRARPNVYVAEALEAKVDLYMKQWSAAANAVTGVMNSGVYQLEQDLNSVFLDGSTEALWQIPGISTSVETNEGAAFVPYTLGYEPTWFVTPSLLNAFEPGDGRMANWLAADPVTDDNGVTTNYYYPNKYKNNAVGQTPQEDEMVLRLGELYLIRAEALAEQGKLDSAKADLNMLRTRAGLPGVTATSQADVLTAVLHERQVELFTEWGNRWFDLVRTGSADAILGKEKTTWKSFQSLLPIPLSEIQLNSKLTQNTGY